MQSAGVANSGRGTGRVLGDQQFVRAQHAAYLNPVRIVLERVCTFSAAVFADQCQWLVPLLSRMIICENTAVRALVKRIFQQFVDPAFSKAEAVQTR